MLDEKDLLAIRELMTDEIGKAIAASEERMTQRIADSETKINQNQQLLIENYFDPKFKILAEGHETLLQTLAPKNRVDELAEEVSFLKSVVAAMNKEISELKKAI